MNPTVVKFVPILCYNVENVDMKEIEWKLLLYLINTLLIVIRQLFSRRAIANIDIAEW